MGEAIVWEDVFAVEFCHRHDFRLEKLSREYCLP